MGRTRSGVVPAITITTTNEIFAQKAPPTPGVLFPRWSPVSSGGQPPPSLLFLIFSFLFFSYFLLFLCGCLFFIFYFYYFLFGCGWGWWFFCCGFSWFVVRGFSTPPLGVCLNCLGPPWGLFKLFGPPLGFV